MYTLRRVLYVQAALFFLVGAALTIAPSIMAVHVFGTPTAFVRERAWVRLAGIEAAGLAMLMTMVAHRLDELWWWAWAFAFTTLAMTAVLVLNAAFGLAAPQSGLAWWLCSLVLLALTCGLLYGLFVSSRERPVP